MRATIPFLFAAFILTGAFSSCKDNPVTPPNGKDTCDTCKVDTTDTTDTPDPNDTTSHAFTWTEFTIPGEASLTGCWVFDDTTLWLIGNSLYEWKGSAWIKRSLVNQFGTTLDGTRSGTSLFGFSTVDTWLIAGGIVWKYDGKVAKEHRLWEPPYNVLEGSDGIRAAWGTSSRDMFFVGDKGTIVHYDGTNWTKFPKVTEKNLRSVWGTSSRDVWASGFNSSTAESVLLHYDGGSWTEIDVGTIGWIGTGKHSLRSVWTCDSAGTKVVIASGSSLWRKSGGGPWRSDSALYPNALGDGSFIGTGARGNSPNDILAVGGWGFAAHWNGRSWHKYDELFNLADLGYGASGFSIKGNTACIVGTKSGKSWIAIGRRK